MGRFKRRFFKEDLSRISYILQEIHSVEQGERSISEFFIDLKMLWEELESSRPIPYYVCEIKCICNLIKLLLNIIFFEYVICF